MPGPARLDLPLTTTDLPNDDGQPCGPGDQATLTQRARDLLQHRLRRRSACKLGADALRTQAAKFGFNDVLRVPMRVAPARSPADLNAPQLAQSAIGQYDVRVTPLQMAMVSAAIANDGVVMKPYLVQTVRGSNLDVIDRTSPEQISQAVSPEVAAQLTRMMEKVVNDGTGTAAQIPGVSVGGKTGTAQHGEGAAPARLVHLLRPGRRPQVAVAVVVEDGGNAGNEAFGGRVAAPIARDVMQGGDRADEPP